MCRRGGSILHCHVNQVNCAEGRGARCNCFFFFITKVVFVKEWRWAGDSTLCTNPLRSLNPSFTAIIRALPLTARHVFFTFSSIPGRGNITPLGSVAVTHLFCPPWCKGVWGAPWHASRGGYSFVGSPFDKEWIMSGEGLGAFTVGDGRSSWDGSSYMLGFTTLTKPPDAQQNPSLRVHNCCWLLRKFI